ncbi:hypothetical protein AAY473_002042 [Plecturocebus cupreus]
MLIYFYVFMYVFIIQPPGLTVSPRLECSGVTIAHFSFQILGSTYHSVVQAGVKLRDLSSLQPLPPGFTQFCLIAGTTGTYHHTQLSFAFLVETGFYHIGQADLELLISGDPGASAFQRITGMVDHTQHPCVSGRHY